jgi:hypothetical protein
MHRLIIHSASFPSWSSCSAWHRRRIFTVSPPLHPLLSYPICCVLVARSHFLDCADLAQNRYFQDPAFNHFLVYLRYWKRPEYACYLRFPQCLAFLDIMTGEETSAQKFWEEMCKEKFRDFVHQQVSWHWQFSHTARAETLDANARERYLAND